MKSVESTHELETIIHQLDQAFDKDPWYGKSITSILDSIEPDRVFDPPAPGVHTIAELVAHMITWREFAEKRLRGDTEYLPEQKESFKWQWRFPKKSNAWQLLRNQLSHGHQNLLSLLHQHDDSTLDQTVTGKPYSFRYLLNGVIQHDLYHTGQIALIHRMHQSENNLINHKIFSFENLSLAK